MIDDDRRLKSKAFFDRGTLVAKIEKYELAIDMYIQGFALDPDDADQHQALRDISLKRKAGGANPIETFTALKLKRSSGDPKQDMLNAERLLAYDPGNADHMLAMYNAATAAGFEATARWIKQILRKTNDDRAKPRW